MLFFSLNYEWEKWNLRIIFVLLIFKLTAGLLKGVLAEERGLVEEGGGYSSQEK